MYSDFHQHFLSYRPNLLKKDSHTMSIAFSICIEVFTHTFDPITL